ncbi:MAG: cysteine desulfurase [Candidatus Marinimicrobia bacterium]|mgnify:CR=1 FL=1|jgi:cysteine desulfurase|nr:cysteine desulfurase [Candidatus Neomarinimicrobiota bacterium]
MKSIYLDYNSTTPIDPIVYNKMEYYFDSNYGNPSSLHWMGVSSKKAVNKSRSLIANGLGCSSNEIIFTSGATESINMAIKGIVASSNITKKHIITFQTEHKAVLDTCEYLEKNDVEVESLPVDEDGFINTNDIIDNIKKETILVTILHGNNEIGTVQQLKRIGEICQNANVPLFIDAAQTFGKIPINVSEMGIAMLAASAHKIYGPKGTGFLYKSNKLLIDPLIHGGGHEHGLRSGTLNVSGIVGLGEAFKRINELRENENKTMNSQIKFLLKSFDVAGLDYSINGPVEDRIPGNINICLKGIDADWLTTMLPNIAIARGSACTSETLQPSHVLRAIGLSDEDANSSIRISLGRFTTDEEISIASNKIINKVLHYFKRRESLAI